MKTKSIFFDINRCDPAKLKPNMLKCKSEYEIDEFISDFAIKFWSRQENIDFDKYGEKPVY